MLFDSFLTRADRSRISEAIARAERRTSGEIRVHVCALPPPRDILDEAKRLFPGLGLEETAARNGVLILLSPKDHRFAIWGDQGIHEKAGQDLWDKAKALLAEGLGRAPGDAVVAAVEEVGRALAQHFPSDGGGRNELGDEVTG